MTQQLKTTLADMIDLAESLIQLDEDDRARELGLERIKSAKKVLGDIPVKKHKIKDLKFMFSYETPQGRDQISISASTMEEAQNMLKHMSLDPNRKFTFVGKHGALE